MNHDYKQSVLSTFPNFESLPKIEAIDDDYKYFELNVSHRSFLIIEINKWPIEYKQNITLMIVIAEYIVRAHGGTKTNNKFTIPNYKIYIKLVNEINDTKQLICTIKKNQILWQPDTEDIKNMYDESDLTANTMYELLQEANDNGTTKY